MSRHDRTKRGGSGNSGGGWRRGPGNPRAHPVELRLRVVREVVDNGAPISEVGRVFGIRVATIAEWVKRYRAGGIDALVPKPIVPRSGRRRWTLGATR